ncbi:MAG TPA: hemagglutinin repeat-containing protein [Lysobacter sp.]
MPALSVQARRLVQASLGSSGPGRGGNGDVTVIARDGDMNVIGSQIEGINTTVVAAGNLNLRSAEETTSLRETNSAKSGEVGFTMGSEAGMGVYVSASGAKGKGTGDSTSYSETIIGGNRGTTTFGSGGNTLVEGAQIIGEKETGRVAGDFTVISQQDTNNYQRKDTSAGIDAAVGTGGGQVSGYVNQNKVNSEYASVEKQSGIQAGAGGVDLYIGGHMQLDGGGIASTAEPSLNRIDVGNLGFTDIQNKAKYDASNIGVSGGGGTTGGNFNSAGGNYNTTGDSASSTTKAGIADGTLIVRDGSGAGIARGVTELQQEALKPIFDANKVAETLEMQQTAAQVGFTAVGDISSVMYNRAKQDAASANNEEDRAAALARMESWSDGGNSKTILHGMTGAAVAALGGGDIARGAVGAAAAEKAKGAMGQYLIDHGVEYGSTEYEALMAAGSAALGSIGGPAGTGAALAGDMYNRQLHPSEEKIIADLVKQGYSEEEVRAVACAMVQCLLGRGLVEPGTLANGLAGDFQLTPAGQNLSNEYQSVLNQMSPAEQAAIAQRLSSTGEFRYTAANAMADAARDVQMGTRLDGLGQSVMGTLGSWASSILCPTTGIACAGVAEGADNFNAGLTSFYTGRPTLTLQNQAWQAAGLTPGQANTAEALLGLGITGGSAASINRQLAAEAKVAAPVRETNGAGRAETPSNLRPDNIRGDGLGVPYEIFDARASKIFGTREGHVPDTPANRDMLHGVANDEAARLGHDAVLSRSR